METCKFRLWQRVLSLVLAAGILCGVMPVSVLAESINNPENVVVEHQPGETQSEPASPENTTPPEQPQPTGTAASSEAVPPAANSEVTPPASSTPADSTPTGDTSSSSTPADSVPADSTAASSTPADSTPEQPDAVEQVTQQLTADGATITVSYPADAFTEKVTAVASRITAESNKAAYEATEAALEKKEDVVFDDFAAFDITFFNAAGAPVEPVVGKNVAVNIVLSEEIVPEDAKNLNVVHIDDELNTEVITAATTTTEVAGASAVASFEAPSFSTFVITWGNQSAQITVHYVDEKGQEIVGSQTGTVKIERNQEIEFDEYAADYPLNVAGYHYKEALLESGEQDVLVSSVWRSWGGTVSLYHNDTWVKTVSSNAPAQVYLVFAQNTELTPVETIDSKAAGIRLKMFNYDSAAGIGGGYYDTNSGSITTKLLKPVITNANGFPTLNTETGGTLAKWFSAGGTEANHLFVKSAYSNSNDPGWFYFNSAEYGAIFDQASGNFNLYEQLVTPKNEEKYFFQRGNFLPFNTIAGLKESSNTVKYDYLGNALAAGNPQFNQQLYLPDQANDFYFGMSMEANFMQPRDGKVNGKDMVFEFTGDDDMWIYVDNTLVLDLGGIHDAQSGSINFATGEVRYTATQTNQPVSWHTTSIKEMFTNAGRSTEGFAGNTFGSYTNHTIKMYYMERGAGASNLRVRFNIPPVIPSTVNVTKEVTGMNAMVADQQQYAMKLLVDGKPLGNADYKITSGADSSIIYKTDRNGVFQLKNGQTATFSNIKENQRYQIEELDANGYQVAFNGKKANNATSDNYVAGTTPSVLVTNHYTAGQNLKITKQMVDGVSAGSQSFTVLVTLQGQAYQGTYQLFNANNSKIKDGTTANGEISLQAGQTILIAGLPTNTAYTVKETGTGTAYALDHYLVNGEEVASSQPAAGKVQSGENTVTVVNKAAPASLTIIKKVEGLSLDEISKNLGELAFTVEKNGPSVKLKDFDNFASMKANEENSYTFTKTFQGIAAGTYTVKESDPRVTGYSLAATIEGEGDGKVTIAAGSKGSVNFTNAYTKSTSAAFSYTVNKVWLDNAAPANWSVSVTLTGTDAQGAVRYTQVATLTAENPSHTWTELLPEYSYQVTEAQSTDGSWTQMPAGEAQSSIDIVNSLRIPNCNIKEFQFANNNAFVFSATGSVGEAYKGKFIIIVPQSTDEATLKVIKEKAKAAGGIFNKMSGANTEVVATQDIAKKGLDKLIQYDANKKMLTFTDTSIWQQVLYLTYSKTMQQTLTNRVLQQANISLQGKKTLQNQTLSANQFNFVITAQNGAPLYENNERKESLTVQNNADGSFLFGGLHYTEANVGKTYRYTIQEQCPEGNTANGITYDTTVYTIDVTVAQEGHGPLQLTVKNGETVLTATNGVYALSAENAATFTNTYKASGSFSITGTKTLNRPINADEFQVVLAETNHEFEVVSGGKTLTANVGADGKFTLENLSFDETSIGTHYFVVSEKNLGNTSIVYDTTPYPLTVVVADGKDGTLSFKVNGKAVDAQGYALSTGAAFNNKYNGEVQSSPITGTKTLTGRPLQADQFTFNLTKTAKYLTSNSQKSNKLTRDTLVESVQNTKDGSITFAPIRYTQEDLGYTYQYTVQEKNAGKTSGGYTYSDAVYTVLHSIRYDTASKTMVVDQTILDQSQHNVDAIKFVNSYAAAGSTTIQATKSLSGRVLEDGKFTFLLYNESQDKVLGTVANSSGNVTFSGLDALKYKQAGEHTYFIHEKVDAQIPGYTFDDGWYKVAVKVTDNGNGVLTATNTYYDANGNLTANEGTTPPTLVNAYAAKGTIAFTGTKLLQYRANAMKQGEFQVQLQEMNDLFSAAIGNAQLVDVAADGSFSIPLSYTQQNVGSHYYLITEKAGTDTTIDYDGSQYRVMVQVADHGDGTLTFEVQAIAAERIALKAIGNQYALSPAGTPTFTNAYKAEGSFKVTGTKNLNRPIKANEFTVQMQQLDASGALMAGVAPVVATIGTDGNFTLNSRAYTAADIGKSYTYLVTEQKGTDSNIDYATTQYTLNVLVGDAGNGALHFTINEENGYDAKKPYLLQGGTEPSFVNAYRATGALSIKGTKSINNRNLRDNEFEFQLAAQKGAPLYAGESTVTAKTVSNQGGAFVFDGLRYTAKDIGNTYTYLLTEAATTANGVTVDPTQYEIKVTVKDGAGSDGSLAFTVQTENGKQTAVSNNGIYTVAPAKNHTATFDNRYAAQTSMQLTGTKVINDRTLRSGEFSFQIEALDNAPLTGATNGKLVVSNTGNLFTFTGLDFTQAHIGHEYAYRITEVDNHVAGVTTDTATYKVKVAVSYDEKADALALKVTGATATGNDGVYALTPETDKAGVFVNTYAAEATQNIAGTKTLANAAMQEGQFQFQLAGADAQSQAKAELIGKLTVSNSAAKKGEAATFDFGKITYNQSDIGKTYTYTVSEVIPDKAENAVLNGITYDKTQFTVKHTIGYNAENNALVVAVALTGNDDSSASAIVFANIYEAEGTKVLTAHKTLSGRPLAAEQFAFTLHDAEGKTLQTAKNDASGNVVFDELKYTTADIGKTFSYTIEEVKKSTPGYTYDAHAYQVEVAVEDGGNGRLNITATYYDANGAAITQGEAAPIANTYKAAGSVAINGSKRLESVADRKMAKEEFSFKLAPLNGAPLKDENGNPLTELVAKNDAKGKFAFAPMYFTESDIGNTENSIASYEYKVTEIEGADGVLTYDSKEFIVVVTISDQKGNGKLETSWSVKDADNADAGIVFTNRYETVDIGVTKEWVDNNNADRLRPESITYHLVANGNTQSPVATAKVTANSHWQALFKDYPKYDANHKAIAYTVVEDEVDYYTTQVVAAAGSTEGTQTKLPVTVRNTIQLGNLILEKRLPVAAYNPALGEAIFTFDVVSTAQEQLAYQGIMLQIDENSKVEGDSYVASITLRGVPVGQYTVTERKDLRYENVTGDTVTVLVQSSAQETGATVMASFTNRLVNEEYFSYASAVVNVYDPATGEYVPTKVSELGGTDGVIVIHGGTEEVVTEKVVTDPFASRDVVLVTDTRTGKVAGDDDEDDGGNTPPAAGPDDPPATITE